MFVTPASNDINSAFFLDYFVMKIFSFQGVFSQLRTIFDLIIKFQLILEGFFEKASRESDYRVEFERGKRQRSKDVSCYNKPSMS